MTTGDTRVKRGLLGLLSLAVASSFLTPAYAARSSAPADRSLRSYLPSSDHVPHQVVVRYRTDVAVAARREVRSAVTADLLKRLPLPRLELVEVEQSTSVAEAIVELERRPEVLYAEPNFLYRAALTPNDPLHDATWALTDTHGDNDLDAPQAWDVTTGSKNVTVAVIDTGVAYDHPDISPNVWTNPGETGSGRETNGVDDDRNGFVDDWRGWDFIDDDNAPFDLHGHGSHVAGTIGAKGNNSIGVAGINWQVNLMALSVLEVDGIGTSGDLASAFTYARRNGAKVVNASLGGPDYSRAMADAISASPNVLFVAASGNEGADIDVNPDYPCSYTYTNVVCVSSSTDRDALSSFSNYGGDTVDLAAPGSNILSASPHFETFFEESFENNISDRWITGGTNDSWSQETDAYGGYISDSPDRNYDNSTNSWLQTRAPIALGGSNGCLLTFSLDLQTERNRDGLVVEASRDGSRWTQLAAYTGDTGDWRSVATSLKDFTGSDVYLRFRLVTDDATTSDGAAIDDLTVECATDRYTSRDYAAYSGTSMAAPHVTGAAALLWSAKPNATATEIKDALLAGADAVPALAEKTVTGARLNLLGALHALDQDLPLPDDPDPDLPDLPDLPGDEPTDEPTDEPSDDPSPSPSVSPSPSPSAPPTGIVHERRVALDLNRHLIAVGRIATEGDTACAFGAKVKILRNGKAIRRAFTSSKGTFRVKLPDRPGRYQAVVRSFSLPSGDACAADRSKVVRHRH